MLDRFLPICWGSGFALFTFGKEGMLQENKQKRKRKQKEGKVAMQDRTECMNEAKHARRGRGADPGRISVACGNISAPGLLRKASAKTCVWWGACGNPRFLAVWMAKNIKNDTRRPQK